MFYPHHEMVSYMFHHLCTFQTISCLKLNSGDFSLSYKDKKKLYITQEKGHKMLLIPLIEGPKCRGSGGNSLQAYE